MTNSTDDYWDIDGTSLETLGWGIESFGGSLESVPEYRGDTLRIPYRVGERWRKQVVSPRTLSFRMWMLNCDEDGTNHSDAQLEANWDTLRGVFWGRADRQVAITRRWNDGANSATGSAIFASGLEPTNTGYHALRFTADMFMADPYFYADSATLGTYTVGAHTPTILGDAPTPKFALTFTGALTNPSVTVTDSGGNVSTLTYSGSLASAETLAVTFPDLTWTASASATPANFTPGQFPWVILHPDATTITIGGSGAGSVKIDYQAAYL